MNNYYEQIDDTEARVTDLFLLYFKDLKGVFPCYQIARNALFIIIILYNTILF